MYGCSTSSFLCPYPEKNYMAADKRRRGEERWKEEKRRPLWLSGCSSTLWPYAAPGGLGIQATVSRRRGHLQMNPGGLFRRRSHQCCNNAAIICWQVRSPGLAQPQSSLQLHRDPFQAVFPPPPPGARTLPPGGLGRNTATSVFCNTFGIIAMWLGQIRT